MMQCLATFETTHMALKFERKCRALGLDVRVVPVPRELSTSCGFACRYPCGERAAVDDAVATNRIDVAGFHELA